MCITVWSSLLLWQTSVYAGAWVREQGSGYIQLSFTYLKSNSLFNKTEPDPLFLNRKVTDNTLGLYGEYGITDDLTVIGYVPWKFMVTDNEILESNFISDTLPSGRLSAFGNSFFILKQKLIQKKHALTAQLRIEAPIDNVDITGLSSGYNNWVFHPSLLLGRGYNRWYYSIDAGFRFRTNNYSNEFYGNLELGYKLVENMNDHIGKNVWVMGVLEPKLSMYDGSVDDGIKINTARFVNNQEYFAWGTKFIYSYNKDYSINLGIYGSFYGNLVMRFPSLNIGISYEW